MLQESSSAATVTLESQTQAACLLGRVGLGYLLTACGVCERTGADLHQHLIRHATW